jgi:hypothetical protein
MSEPAGCVVIGCHLGDPCTQYKHAWQSKPTSECGVGRASDMIGPLAVAISFTVNDYIKRETRRLAPDDADGWYFEVRNNTPS